MRENNDVAISLLNCKIHFGITPTIKINPSRNTLETFKIFQVLYTNSSNENDHEHEHLNLHQVKKLQRICEDFIERKNKLSAKGSRLKISMRSCKIEIGKGKVSSINLDEKSWGTYIDKKRWRTHDIFEILYTPSPGGPNSEEPDYEHIIPNLWNVKKLRRICEEYIKYKEKLSNGTNKKR
jgi:hypothetical protein